MKLTEIIKLIGGELINNDEIIEIKNIKPLSNAEENDISFIFDKTPTTINSKAKCIVCKEKIASYKFTQIIHSQPRLAMAKLLNHMFPDGLSELVQFISDKADIAQSVTFNSPIEINAFVSIGANTTIGKNTRISSNVSIGKNCQIGSNCIIWPNVSIYDNTIIGDNTIIHSNAALGSDGFGYEKTNNKWEKIPHISNIIIGKNVEIGSNTSIDKGCLNPTMIHDGVKIDNHIHIAHNCSIGKNTIIVAGTLIGGSVSIGENCILAGSVSVIDNISIGNNVTILAKSGVTKSIPDNEVMSGFPAINHKKEIQRQAFINRLYKSSN